MPNRAIMEQIDQKKGGAGMSQAIRYAVKKDVILWAIEESQKNMCDVELKFPKISEWICGNSNILIASSRQWYPFDIMPGFWTQLVEKGEGKLV